MQLTYASMDFRVGILLSLLNPTKNGFFINNFPPSPNQRQGKREEINEQ
jgi:hypothetical protein